MLDQRSFSFGIVCGAAGAAAVAKLVNRRRRATPAAAPEPDHTAARALVWRCIGGAMSASQLFIGDHLGLYAALRDLCAADPDGDGATTAIALAAHTSLDRRWLREWLAQQASLGVLVLLDGDGDGDADLRYRLPPAFAAVLADPASPHHDIGMIQLVPALLERARTTLPDAFRTGRGRPYDDADITAAIDRQHARHIRDVVLPRVLPLAGGDLLAKLEAGARVAELGCGGGNLLVALARSFPRSRFDGFEVSDAALEHAAARVARSGLANASVRDARDEPLDRAAERDPYDIIVTFDVLHDAATPADLIRQARAALRPDGVWLLADVAGEDGVRANVRANAAASTMLAFSTCLCMSCALSEEGGAGLGTLGFSKAVANEMLGAGGFGRVRVLLEQDNTRWFEVMV